MSDTPEEREFELRAQIGAIWSGGRLFIGMYTFLLASLAFSYFYLRSSNNGLLWRPNHITAPTAYGWTIYCLTLLAVLMAIFGQSRLRRGNVAEWQTAIWVGVVASLLALFLQIWEFTALLLDSFAIAAQSLVGAALGSSGYASTFIGYSVFNIMTIFIVAYWMETTVARSHRMPKEMEEINCHLSGHPIAQAFRANVASMTYFLGFVALASTLLFAMFYLL